MPHLLEGIVLHAGHILLVVLILIAGIDLLEGFFHMFVCRTRFADSLVSFAGLVYLQVFFHLQAWFGL